MKRIITIFLTLALIVTTLIACAKEPVIENLAAENTVTTTITATPTTFIPETTIFLP